MRNARTLAVSLVVVAIIGLFGFTVWPTPYQYRDARSPYRLMRINRITQHVSWLTNEGWVELRPERPSATTMGAKTRLATSDEVASVRFNPTMIDCRYGHGYLDFDFFNGTAYPITRMRLTLRVPDGTRWKDYAQDHLHLCLIPPQTWSHQTAELTNVPDPPNNWSASADLITVDDFSGASR